MKTLLSWTVANLGGVFVCLFAAVYEIMLLCGAVPVFGSFAYMSLVGLLVICGAFEFAGGIQIQNTVGDVCNLVLIGAIYYFAFAHERYAGMYLPSVGAFAWCIVPAIVFGLCVAVFTARNFDDVVSRRMLYRNSAVDMFEMEMKYVFNRFVSAMSAVTAMAVLLAVWRLMIFFNELAD